MRSRASSDAPFALILVRNTVTHDARVLREARTLRDLGFEVLVAGVVSTSERARGSRIEGIQVLRLAPGDALGNARRWLRRHRSGTGTPGAQTQARSARLVPPPAAPSTRSAARLRSKRLAVTLAYYLQGIALVRRTSPTLVHANDYNTMWIGIAAKLLRRSRLVYDCHELWPDRNGRPEWRPWLVFCEALFVRLADATITTSPGYAAAIAGRYRVRPPVVVRNIPANRADPARRINRASDPRAPLAVYIGGLMPGRGLEQAIGALAQAPGMQLRLIGPGSESYTATLRARAEEAGVSDRFELQPAVPPTAVVESIAEADLGLMLIQPVCRSYELTLPNKLFEYAAAGVPILASDLPVIGPLVRLEKLGEVVPPTDVALIAQAMQRLADPRVNGQARERVCAFAKREVWDRERVVLEGVYESVTSSTARD